MRTFAAAVIGFLFCAACGGEEAKPPQAPTPPAPPPAPAMTAEAPKEEPKPKESAAQLEDKTARGIVAAMNAHDAKKVASYYTDAAIVKIAGAPADPTGREAIAASFQKLFEAFPDYKTAPARVWAKGDVAVIEWVMNGTHQGDLWGAKGTEKKVGLNGIDVLWFTPEGQVKEHHVYYDGVTIFSQVGLSKQKARPIPAMPSAPPQMFGMKPPSGSQGAGDGAANIEVVKTLVDAMDATTVSAAQPWAKKESQYLDKLVDNVEFDDMSQPQTSKGKAEAKKFLKEFRTGFPDAKPTIQNIWAMDDFVIVEGSWTGTHKGAFFGMQPTKKPVVERSVDIYQLKDGKVVHGWVYANSADFMQQLGLMPGPKKPAEKPAEKK